MSSHRVQASGEEWWHANSKNDVPKDIMLKFPQVIVKGMPAETTVDDFLRYIEQELSPSPIIVGTKLGPTYSGSAIVHIYCAVLCPTDLDSIRTSPLLSIHPASRSVEGAPLLTESPPQLLCVAEESKDCLERLTWRLLRSRRIGECGPTQRCRRTFEPEYFPRMESWTPN